MERDDLELFERSLRAAIATHTGADLDAALDELGWRDALRDDPRAAVSLLFDLQGRANATSGALDQLLADALGFDGDAVVLPTLGSAEPPAVLDGTHVVVRGVGSAALARAGSAVVVAASDDGVVAGAVATSELENRPVEGLDPTVGLVTIDGRVALVGVRPVDWAAAVRVARLALAHELLGASRRMLELARQHALERIQFGVPIASFQAVRHRLAETLVAIEMTEAALDGGWIDAAPHHVLIAKALAGRSARVASRHCQQVLAGIGFTMEHPFHRSFRRVLLLDELFGSSRSLTTELGRELLATRQLPPLLPL